MDPPPSTPSRILEITLFSAQDLVHVSKNMKTYAVVWIQHENNTTTTNNKQATNVDQTGGTDPTWNDKFMFQTDDKFLNSEDATVFVEVYAAAWDEDALIGYINILVKDIVNATGTLALQICLPSGRSQGILNIEVAHKYLTMEDKDNGSMVNGSSICNSDVGPSISVVAAAIEKGLYKPQVHNQNHQSKEATQIKEWTKKEKAKAREVGGRWPSESPPGSIVAVPYQPSEQRTSKGKKNEGKKLFSCLGCEISVTCGGEDRKKNKKKHENSSNKVCNLSSVNDYHGQ